MLYSLFLTEITAHVAQHIGPISFGLCNPISLLCVLLAALSMRGPDANMVGVRRWSPRLGHDTAAVRRGLP